MMVPVRDASGAAVAVFAFRIHPRQMSAVLNGARLGESGETYVVDADGRMVTESRFAEQVARLGLLPAEAEGRMTAVARGSRSRRQLWPRDRPRRRRRRPGRSPGPWPRPWRAGPASNADGYRDYRGVAGGGSVAVAARLGHRRRHRDRPRRRPTRRSRWSAGPSRVLGVGLLLVAGAIALSSRRIYGLQKEVQRAQRARAVHARGQDRRGRHGRRLPGAPRVPAPARPPSS